MSPTRSQIFVRSIGHAFTLIELLVVIAIITVLLGLLLPSLGQAQRVAESAVCGAHLRGVGQGMSTYGADSFFTFAGPNTSGAQLTKSNDPSDYNGGATDPWQNADWISPTLGDSMGLPADRNERIAAMFNSELSCPSNAYNWTKQHAGPAVPDPTSIRTSSYLTPWWFHWAHPSSPPFSNAIYQFTADIEVPVAYRPRLTNIGPPASKVYAMDGTRYVARDFASGVFNDVDFQTWARVISGNSFSGNGPAITKFNGSPYYRVNGELSDAAKSYGYRHDGKMNAVFFDGHVESLDDEASRPVRLYAPTGTVINDAADTIDPGDSDGQQVG